LRNCPEGRRNGRSPGDVDLAMGLKWDQAEEIAEVLAENHPGLNPLDARFTDLRQWIIDLDEFDDNRDGSTEGKLEAIQMAWHEIYKEQNEDDSE
jgi:FeS assembly protein IscX